MTRRPPRSPLFPYTTLFRPLRAVTPPRQLTVDTWVQDGSVSVGVGDNGKGVTPEIAPRLFRPFATTDRKSTRLNSSHSQISYAVFCLQKKQRMCSTPRLRFR